MDFRGFTHTCFHQCFLASSHCLQRWRPLWPESILQPCGRGSALEPTQEAFHPQIYVLDFQPGSASTGFSTELHWDPTCPLSIHTRASSQSVQRGERGRHSKNPEIVNRILAVHGAQTDPAPGHLPDRGLAAPCPLGSWALVTATCASLKATPHGRLFQEHIRSDLCKGQKIVSMAKLPGD